MKVVVRSEDARLPGHLIAVTDGLKGMSEAPTAVFPATTLQTCIIHLIRQSLDFANWRERKLDIRRVMSTSNALESVHSQMR
jgi:putative transposase